MNILILYDRYIFKQYNEYFTDEISLNFLFNFSKYFDKVSICIPVYKTLPEMGTRFFKISPDENGIIEIKATFPYKSVIDFYKKIPIIILYNLFILTRVIKHSDLIFMHLPAMNSFIAALLAWIFNKPVISYFVGDEKRIVEVGNKYKGLQRVIAIFISSIHNLIYTKIVRNSRAAFFLSSDLKNRFQKYNTRSYLAFSSLIQNNNIHIKKIRKSINVVKLLYVGALRHEKGINYLIQCVQCLIHDGFKVKLYICGDGPERDTYQNFVKYGGLDKFIDFLGNVPWGERLFKIYINCDIFILPSLSEGVPRVLLEAMANGLPIVASRVGGISDIIKNMRNGILVPPSSPYALKDAVKILINDFNLRKTIIENGYKYVMKHTAEKQIEGIVKKIII